MVALLHPEQIPHRRRNGALDSTGDRPRPQLRLLQGGAQTATPDAESMRFVVVGVVAILLVAVVGIRLLQGTPGVVAPDSQPVAPAETGEAVRVVAPGETLWSIAVELSDQGDDVRPTVAALAARNQGSALQAGQQLIIPVGLGG